MEPTASSGSAGRSISVLLHGKAEYTTLTVRGEVRVVSVGSLEIPFRHVVACSFQEDNRHLEIAYVARNKSRGPLVFTKLHGQVREADWGAATEWCAGLTQMAYEGVQRNRRFQVLINPNSGKGKAVTIFSGVIQPILEAAGCSLDVIHTTYSGHASEIASKLSLDHFDVVLVVSGDGLIHEVLNGFANHSRPRKAMVIPIAPIPAGSGNALSLNLLGIKDGFDIVAATINALKGKPMNVDLLSFTQNGKRTISFVTQSIGMLADMDIGTDQLRWMGDKRFTYGFLRELAKMKPCNVELSYKAETVDKDQMVQELRKRRENTVEGTTLLQGSVPEASEHEDELPPSKYSTTDMEGWTVHKEPMMYIYAGKGPYVGRDYMPFPVSLPDDGLIDIVVRDVSSRMDLLSSSLDGWANGEVYWKDNVKYIKAHAYRVKPFPAKVPSTLAVDGEPFPPQEFQVEVLPKLGTFLSPQNHYATEFKC